MSMKEMISKFVDAKKEIFTEVSRKIWENPEVGFKEFIAAETICTVLEKEGFTVEKGLSGIPTAFKGTFGNGKPIIGILGEYDALPLLSQKACLAVPEDLVVDGNGHGCGHNVGGAGALAAVVALKDYMIQEKVSGTIVYYGCPGEEYGCGKAFMARDGEFDSIDCALSWHPSENTLAWSVSSLANISVNFTFKGKSSHAAATPHLGRSALDAAELMNIGVNFLREHMIDQARVHYAFNDVGGQAPNVVQDRAQLHYYIRSPRIEQVKELFERVEKIAHGAAMMTETECKVEVKDGLSDYIPNDVITTLLGEAMLELGPIPFDKADKELAGKFRATITENERIASESQREMMMGEKHSAKYKYSKDLVLFEDVVPYIPSTVVVPGSTDVGDVSYVVPTAQLLAASLCLGTPAHSWQQTAQSNSPISDKGLIYAGKAMALTAAKILHNPEVLIGAKEELARKTGGKYICPFSDDIKPNLDY